MADEFPASIPGGARDRLICSDGRAVDRQDGLELQLIEQVKETPEAYAVTVFMPCPIGDIGAGGTPGRRRQYGARHRFARIPLFDVDDDPNSEAGAVGQREARARGNGRISDAFVRQHGGPPDMVHYNL